MSDGTSRHPNSQTLPAANLEMVSIDAVRESNAQMKGLEDYVAVFIGGTTAHGKLDSTPIAY